MRSDTRVTRRELIGGAALVGAAMVSGVLDAAPTGRGRQGMYVSVRDEILMQGGYASVAEGLADCGLDAVEVNVRRDFGALPITPTADRPLLHLDNDDDVKRLADQAHAASVRISGFLVGNDFNATDVQPQLDWVARVVQVAAQLGVPVVRVDPIMSGDGQLTPEQHSAIFARGVNYVLDHTKGLKVDLGIENHGAKGNDADFLEGEIKHVGSKRLGVTMDMGNFYWAGYPVEEVYGILKRLAPYAKHTHVKNIAYPADMRNTRRAVGYEYGKYMCPIPEGDLDLKRIVGFLKAAGYRRDLCIEDESLGKFEAPARRQHLRAAADYLKSVL